MDHEIESLQSLVLVPAKKKVQKQDQYFNWLNLPYELWLQIMVEYGLSAKDLAHMELTCRWFSWKGITEEAARLLHRGMKPRVGELTNRVLGESWKEKLFYLETMISILPTLSAGSFQNIAIQNGKLYTWGAGRFGQLGNNVRTDKAQPQDITLAIPPESGRVVQVSAGCGHSGLVTDCGHAYTFGDNRYNQLGHSSDRSRTCPFPTRVGKELSSRRIRQVACGSSHTLFLTDMGQVYVNGEGDCGQLGLGTRHGIAQDPTLLPFPYDEHSIVFVTTGIGHNILLTHCGKAFTFGLASQGQLGHGGTKNISQPTLVSVLLRKRIVVAAAGVSHSIFIDSDGVAYTCGTGKGFLGHGDGRIKTVPTKVAALDAQGVKVVKAAAGVGKSIFISSKGQGYWCGEWTGELESSSVSIPVRMDLPEPLVSASIGNSHVVLTMKSGRIMCMGKNTRYQSGEDDENSVVRSYAYIDV
ncbi:uncharacterized protein LOC135348856 isoform X2 [Halichondria panicea]|uniref:uncharacterized protein LOC135348856 isoform X2 n=1 Tax=Halichondria panicea TaxID=6063 RepID=UPI00312B46AF